MDHRAAGGSKEASYVRVPYMFYQDDEKRSDSN